MGEGRAGREVFEKVEADGENMGDGEEDKGF